MDFQAKEKYKDYKLVINTLDQFKNVTKTYDGTMIIECDNDDDLFEIDDFHKAEITICGKTRCNIVNSHIESIYGNTKINYIYNSLINEITGNVEIYQINNYSIIDYICGNIKIDQINNDVYIKSICGDTYINNIYDNVIIKQIFGNVVIDNILDCSIIIVLDKDVKINNTLGNCKIVYSYTYDKEINLDDSNKLKMKNDLSKPDYQLQRFFIINNLKVKNDKIILYKIIGNDLIDLENKKIKYSLTIMNYIDWNPKGGFILYPNIKFDKYYNIKNICKIIKCEVEIDQIVINCENIKQAECKKIKILDIIS